MRIKRIFGYIIGLFLILLVLGFTSLNASPVAFHYYFGTYSLPLALLLVYVLGIGIFLAMLGMLWPLLRLKLENQSLKKRFLKDASHVGHQPEENGM